MLETSFFCGFERLLLVQQIVAPEEKLSAHVYEYDAKEKELYRADKSEEHEQKHV